MLINARQELLAKAQEEREAIARRMAEMESKLIVGGVNLVILW
jgi:hypothetical protein